MWRLSAVVLRIWRLGRLCKRLLMLRLNQEIKNLRLALWMSSMTETTNSDDILNPETTHLMTCSQISRFSIIQIWIPTPILWPLDFCKSIITMDAAAPGLREPKALSATRKPTNPLNTAGMLVSFSTQRSL